jgi:hypothetical protein
VAPLRPNHEGGRVDLVGVGGRHVEGHAPESTLAHGPNLPLGATSTQQSRPSRHSACPNLPTSLNRIASHGAARRRWVDQASPLDFPSQGEVPLLSFESRGYPAQRDKQDGDLGQDDSRRGGLMQRGDAREDK